MSDALLVSAFQRQKECLLLLEGRHKQHFDHTKTLLMWNSRFIYKKNLLFQDLEKGK